MIRIENANFLRNLPTVNRCAVTLEPTELYLEWAKRTPEEDDDLTLDELTQDSTCYLIPDMDREPDRWLRRQYAEMFTYELNSWCTDETLWPTDRSFENFQRFFRVHFHSIVIDMGSGTVDRDGI